MWCYGYIRDVDSILLLLLLEPAQLEVLGPGKCHQSAVVKVYVHKYSRHIYNMKHGIIGQFSPDIVEIHI